MTKLTWPCWFTSPDGSETEIFDHESDVPHGWTSGAEKITLEKPQKPEPKKPAAHEPSPMSALEKRGRKPKPEPLDL